MVHQKTLLVVILLLFLISPILWKENTAQSSPFNQIDKSVLNELKITNIYNITETLSAYRTRLTGSSECLSAANYIKTELHTTFNISDVLFEEWEYNGSTSLNVIARINGTTLEDEIIVICAHFDSISESESAPGANDNAVAVALCMEVMRVKQKLGKLNRTLLFIAFSGEEQNFIGSQAWIAQHKEVLPNVVAVLNLDMIGYGDHIVLIKNDQSDWLADLIIAVATPVNTTLAKTNSIYPETARFDHDSFWAAGIPCVSLFEGGKEYLYYHTANDTIDKISFSLVEKFAQTLLLSVVYLGTSSFQYDALLSPLLIGCMWGIAGIFTFLVYRKLN
ncbi:MAG: M28 family metallopeptidase [Candidatus Helarchaeota archaeon]